MFIEINDSKTIREIQEEFSSQFPFLKIEFFEKPHGYGEASKEVLLFPGQALRQIRDKHVVGLIAIDPARETGAVEQEFERRFGLHVQVYRKLFDQWIQTVATDVLTLEQQNLIAKDSVTYNHKNHTPGHGK